MVNVKSDGYDDTKVREELRRDQSGVTKLFNNNINGYNVNNGSIEFQINVLSEEKWTCIRDMIENKVFEKNFSSWMKEKGFEVKEDAQFEIKFSKLGERDVLQVKEDIQSIKKAGMILNNVIIM